MTASKNHSCIILLLCKYICQLPTPRLSYQICNKSTINAAEEEADSVVAAAA
jgi:hypothetical protein